MNKLNYRRALFISIILITVGIVLNTLIKENVTAIGTVFIAVGGLFFIISMAKKKSQEQNNSAKNENKI